VARNKNAPVTDVNLPDIDSQNSAIGRHFSHQGSDDESGGDVFDIILDKAYNQEVDYYLKCDIRRLAYVNNYRSVDTTSYG